MVLHEDGAIVLHMLTLKQFSVWAKIINCVVKR